MSKSTMANSARFLCFGLFAILGCRTTPTESPRYTRPPEMVQRPTWTRRLPGGVFHSQTPSAIGLLVTGHRLSTVEEVDEFLKEEERQAWEASGSSQVSYHFYVDGKGNLYSGRSLECEAPQIAKHDPDGLVWVAFLDKELDLYVNEEARQKVVHLLTYLCFAYNISPEAFVLECEPEAEASRLCPDLGGTLIPDEVKAAFTKLQQELNGDSTGYLHIRTHDLRTRPSDE